MSFFFNCCKQDATSGGGKIYQIQKRQGNITKTQYVNTLKNLKGVQDAAVLRVNKSQYEQINKMHDQNNPWTDPSFVPGPRSLGTIPNVPPNCEWKRLSQIVKTPQLFQGRIQPHDVIQGSLGDCYFLSAVAALAQKEGRILKVFGNQKFNPAGVYRVTLRIDGQIQEILVDDYVPVNKANKPLFCQPNNNQLWVLLLEKAWAKAHGSYANINSGTPSQVFKAVTYAPSQLKPIKNDPNYLNNLWQDIFQGCQKQNPICCGTVNNNAIKWDQVGLVQGHAYSLIGAANITDNQKQYRIMKFRNPWGYNQWNGLGNQNDHGFWSRIVPTPQKQQFLGKSPFGNDGVFFMLYQDFCQFFNQVHICNLIDNPVYQVQKMYADGKHGSIFTFKVDQPGEYFIQLHQSGIRGQSDIRLKQGLNRSTLLIAKGNNYQFIDGSLKYQQQDNSLKLNLTPGQYYIYAKVDPTLEHKLLPQTLSVSSYSQHFVDIIPLSKKDHPFFFNKVFLSYARGNKRKKMNNDLMWISWKLFFQKGGFAYLAFGVDIKSDKKFIIKIKESDFNQLGYVLKKPHKGRGDQTIQVRPGQEEIIVARVKNGQLLSMTFPPPMDIHTDRA